MVRHPWKTPHNSIGPLRQEEKPLSARTVEYKKLEPKPIQHDSEVPYVSKILPPAISLGEKW
jgi:hypothetical protein